MADLLKSWERKRKAYKQLPHVIRYLLVGLAFLLLPVGVMAMFTPLAVFEVGSISIFASLTILSFEFSWAYTLLAALRSGLRDKRFRRKMLVFTLAVLVAYAGLILSRF